MEFLNKLQSVLTVLFTKKKGQSAAPYVPIRSKALMDQVLKERMAQARKWATNPHRQLDIDPDAFYFMRRNADIIAAKETRVTKTLSRDLKCSNPYVKKYLESFPNYRTMLRWLAEDGFGLGISVIKIDWDARMFFHVDFNKIVLVQDKDTYWKWAIQDIDGVAHIIDPANHLVFVHNQVDSTLGFGSGYFMESYWEYTNYNTLIRKALDSMDGLNGAGSLLALGLPLQAMRNQGEEAIEAYLLAEATRAIEMKQTGVFVYDSQIAIDFLTGKPFPPELLELIRESALKIIRIIQGATLNTGGENTAGGNRAMAEVADEQTVERAEVDREELLYPLTILYQRAWEHLGGIHEQPVVEWAELVKGLSVDQLKFNLDAVGWLFEHGFTLDKNEVGEKLGGWTLDPTKMSQPVNALEYNLIKAKLDKLAKLFPNKEEDNNVI